MRFQFKIQPYQTDAVEAVVQVFSGQPNYCQTRYIRDLGIKSNELPQDDDGQLQFTQLVSQPEDDPDPTGYKNAEIELPDGQLLSNIRTLQLQNNIKQSATLVTGLGRCSLDIEMETGTGKTYVYTKTMFELNRRYGWSKFIIVVPSVAIREGVKKSLEMTEEHFMQCYGKKARFFVYNSQDLQPLDDFSSDSGINVMIVNTQAFAASLNEAKNVEGRKGDAAARIIYSRPDRFGSRRPIDVLSANRPVLILDEPQKMGGEVTQKALKQFRSLFTLHYSATHAKQHNLIYVLDALDAFNQRLVKKIEVKGFEIKNLRGTNRYLCLEEIVLSNKKPPVARLELEVGHSAGAKREVHLLNVGDQLFNLSNEMEQYRGYTIADIDPIRRVVSFTNGESIAVGEMQGNDVEPHMRRIQIRETILSHFEKEEVLFQQGIKTLSLFFIDEVKHYRVYDEDGQEQLGEYGVIFEEEYLAVLNQYLSMEPSPYQAYLRKMCSDPHAVHQGYFSIDKKTKRSINSEIKRGMEISDDTSAYDLILKDKERLLSFDEPTRFIFSHSALREGWDNPNVFQICTLKHSDSQTAKRQEVGRGLRLCVNQNGNRMDAESCGDAVHDINKLTVIASESYTTFVSDLQKDIRMDLYDRPTKASVEYFTGKTVKTGDKEVIISAAQANTIHYYLVRNGYIDQHDQVTDVYRNAASAGTLVPLPDELGGMTESVHQLVQAIFDERVLEKMTEDGNAPKVKGNPLNKNWGTFAPMWECINHKYAYSVKNLDSDLLIQKAIDLINEKMAVTELQYIEITGQQRATMNEYELERGESFESTKSSTKKLDRVSAGQVEYDLIGKIASGTMLTRRTVAAILKGIHPQKFACYQKNPEEFLSKAIQLIEDVKSDMVVDGIEYRQIEGGYDEQIFVSAKTPQSFERAFRAKKHIQDYVFTDGTAEKSVERLFAENLDISDQVCVYAKLPRNYQIPTPVGFYSPDWAIMFKEGKVQHIYFIAETKGTEDESQLRPVEAAKIRCAKKLFNEMSNSRVRYDHVADYQGLMDIVIKISV